MPDPDTNDSKLADSKLADSPQPSGLFSFLQFDLSTISLIVVNFLPVIGGLFFGWDIRSILIVYWAENLVIGFYNVLKMTKAQNEVGATKAFLIPFFIVHFGGFCTGHGVFILVFMFSGLIGDGMGMEFDPFEGAFDLPGPLGFLVLPINTLSFIWAAFGFSVLIPVIGLLISHGISFKTNFLDKKEYESTTIGQQMFQPYGRIVIMHISIIFAAVPVFLLGSPMPLLILLVILKTIVDLFFHAASHQGGLFKMLAKSSPQMQELLKHWEDRRSGRINHDEK